MVLVIGDKELDEERLRREARENGMELEFSKVGKMVSEIAEKLYRLTCEDYDVVFTIGGTGIEDDDLAPEATNRIIDKRLPGIEYFIFRETVKNALEGMFARIVAGMRRNTFVINLPGYGYEQVFPKLIEAIKLIREGVSPV